MSELTLVVHIRAKPGQADALEKELCIAVPPTHKEAGCLRFALHRSKTDSDAFLLVERWRSQQALDEHLKKPYLTHLLARLKDLAETSDARLFEMLAEGDPAKLL